MRDPRENKIIWEIPGGRMNINEKPREAVAREIREELGIEITVGAVVHIEQFIQGNEGKRAFVIVYECQMTDLEQSIVMSEAEVCEIAWISAAELLL